MIYSIVISDSFTAINRGIVNSKWSSSVLLHKFEAIRCESVNRLVKKQIIIDDVFVRYQDSDLKNCNYTIK